MPSLHSQINYSLLNSSVTRFVACDVHQPANCFFYVKKNAKKRKCETWIVGSIANFLENIYIILKIYNNK